ncbi:MAG: D-alanyl-D-alanine carboxypeptidase [Clostridia bacterium]|nr:D-alanyl-D-alanine carboxypeptidase [Clostridia bacterium]
MTKRWAAGLFMALVFMYNHSGCLAQGETSAKAACILEMRTGRVLFESNMHQRLPMASTTKVMTALLAIELGNAQDEVICSENAFGVSGTSIYLQLGERLTLEQMLLGLMLSSGNDASVAIAEHIAGTVDGFVALMNARAGEIGAVNTHFANPHGLPDEDHYTTAYDLALISREAMKNESFRRLVSMKKASIPWEGRSYDRQLTNKNRLLSDYPGATGVKTGFTSKAGRCLVFGAQRDGMEVVGAVLSCSDWFDEAQRLMDGCYATYSMTRMLGPTLSAGEIAVTDGERDHCGMCVMEPLEIPLAVGEAAQVVLDVPQQIQAPVYPGMHLGTARLVVGGSVYAEGEVVASERVKTDAIRMDVRRILAHWML